MMHPLCNRHCPSVLKNQKVHPRQSLLPDKKEARPKQSSGKVRRWGRFMIALVTIFVINLAAMDTGTLSFIPPGYSVDGERQPPVTRLDRTQIADLLKGHMEQLSDAGHFTVTDTKGRQLTVKTFLDNYWLSRNL